MGHNGWQYQQHTYNDSSQEGISGSRCVHNLFNWRGRHFDDLRERVDSDALYQNNQQNISPKNEVGCRVDKINVMRLKKGKKQGRDVKVLSCTHTE